MLIAQQSESAAPISAAARPEFNRLANTMRTQLASAELIQQAKTD